MAESCWQTEFLERWEGRKKTEETGREKTEVDNLSGHFSSVTPLSWSQDQFATLLRREEGKSDIRSSWRKSFTSSQFVKAADADVSIHPAVQARVWSAILVTPVADAGDQHDLSLPSGHLPTLAYRLLPSPLPRPGLHLTTGGGGRGCPAEVPASLPGEQPATLGQSENNHIYQLFCLHEIYLYFWEAQTFPVSLNNLAAAGLRMKAFCCLGMCEVLKYVCVCTCCQMLGFWKCKWKSLGAREERKKRHWEKKLGIINIKDTHWGAKIRVMFATSVCRMVILRKLRRSIGKENLQMLHRDS